MLTHADEFICFCHCTCHTHSFCLQRLLCVKHAGYSHIKTYNIEISRDNCKVLVAHPAQNINTAGERETWTRNTLGFFTLAHSSLYAPCISKNGFPSPHTPPPSIHALCVCARMGSAVSFHYWDKNHNSPGMPDLVKSHSIEAVFVQLVSLPSMYCKWGRHPSVVCMLLSWDCSRNGGTLQNLRVRSHLHFVYFGPNHARMRYVV